MFTIIPLNSLVDSDFLFPLSLLVGFFWFVFFVVCLFVFGFYHVSSSTARFCVLSFHMIYCVCGLFSAGCKVVVPLVCGVCPQKVGMD